MNLAVGRLVEPQSRRALGTVFAVTRTLALTAFHCVGDQNEIFAKRVLCIWPTATSAATVMESINSMTLPFYD